MILMASMNSVGNVKKNGIIKLDVTNAFNSAQRKSILEALLTSDDFGHLTPLVHALLSAALCPSVR